MNDEIDYALTPDQWETLKALRVPASRFSTLNQFVLDDLVALGLATISDNIPAITPAGTQGADQGLVQVMGCRRLTLHHSWHHQAPHCQRRRRQRSCPRPPVEAPGIFVLLLACLPGAQSRTGQKCAPCGGVPPMTSLIPRRRTTRNNPSNPFTLRADKICVSGPRLSHSGATLWWTSDRFKIAFLAQMGLFDPLPWALKHHGRNATGRRPRPNRKTQFFPIVNATISGGDVQMRFPDDLGGSPNDRLREIAATARSTHPMAGS